MARFVRHECSKDFIGDGEADLTEKASTPYRLLHILHLRPNPLPPKPPLLIHFLQIGSSSERDLWASGHLLHIIDVAHGEMTYAADHFLVTSTTVSPTVVCTVTPAAVLSPVTAPELRTVLIETARIAVIVPLAAHRHPILALSVAPQNTPPAITRCRNHRTHFGEILRCEQIWLKYYRPYSPYKQQ